MAKKLTGETASAKAVALIYVGPQLLYLRLGSTFSSSALPIFIHRYAQECPEIRALLVPASDFLTARVEVARVGSELWAAAQAVTKHFAGGNKI